MKDYWIWYIDLKNERSEIKTFMKSNANPCHKAIKFVKSKRKGDKFYLDGNKIIRHRIDVVGTFKVKRIEQECR